MVDYNKDTGSSGTMRIRDTGTTVEFWITSGNSSTFHSSLPWGYTVNGVTNNNREFNYKAGSGWEKLGSWTVSTDQTVTFRLGDTNTSGFGGPTTLSVSIERASAPSAPPPPNVSQITHNSVGVTFIDGANNGAAIDLRQIGYSYTQWVADGSIVSSDGSTTLTGLLSGTTYNIWTRTHNVKGYSPWSTARKITTLKAPDAPDTPIVSNLTQVSMVISFTDNGTGGAAILERQIHVNTVNSTSGGWTFPYTGVMTLVSLQPATTYYVRARVRNSAGWGPYSGVSVDRTIAGAWVKVGAEWKEAIPYVNVGGVWKLVRPWVRTAGVWKEST